MNDNKNNMEDILKTLSQEEIAMWICELAEYCKEKGIDEPTDDEIEVILKKVHNAGSKRS